MLLETFFDMLELHRDDKFVSLRFLRPFKVISTSMPDGGLASHLDLVFNHQCSEPAAHTIAHHSKIFFNPDGYRAALLAEHGLEKAAAAGLGTAANMNNMCVVQESHLDLSIVAIVTGGVEGNAARAGDPASFYEQGGTFHRRGDIAPEQPGTINIMLACNTPLTDGALVRAVMTATEAKSVVLQELSVPSRQSPSIATGTGTDQIAVMAPSDGAFPIVSAGHHSVLGELIARTVIRALKGALVLQNGLTPNRQCSCGQLLERFGAGTDALGERIADLLAGDAAELARRNRFAVDRDPLTVAAVAALIHLYDQVSWEVLPAACWPEIAVHHGAQIAVAASGCVERRDDYQRALSKKATSRTPDSLVETVANAIALGFVDKWKKAEVRIACIEAPPELTL